ncbi:recombination mediator RecR [Arcanobacterium pinnipediorum]|uniref:Recombination protein RecR n=1 Tax=Arcanobacterium pinnipediorum TaxID=1503041 RepID=A0ABY5AHE3_9ACTO|nr:recombination mediator RecR [Arcanobacterium pinnipediorum]USR79275.1 recombination mediator RecR [Arcanobacterium pinnipediorum]
MAGVYDGALQSLIDELGRLPGVGPKSAQRIAFHLLEADDDDVVALIDSLQAVKAKVHFCRVCGNIAEGDLCRICSDLRRIDSTICVVEEAKDIIAIERSREYRGKYHVLGGAIDPIGGVGPDNLRIRELYARIQQGGVEEIILAMDPNVEGEATATYLAINLAHMGVIVSRLASGLPVGGDLEYADEVTISRALEGRQRIHTPAS